jgi:hypothetical protein
MAGRSKKSPIRRVVSGKKREASVAVATLPEGPPPQAFLAAQLDGGSVRAGGRTASDLPSVDELKRHLRDLNVRPTVPVDRLLHSIARIKPEARVPFRKLPEEIRESIAVQKPRTRSFHGAKFSLAYFPWPTIFSPCANKFGYMSSTITRNATKLPFNPAMEALLNQLGDLMGAPGRDVVESNIPAGFTYLGQFVDHDITLDVSSSLDAPTDANTITNMRTPSLDLDSLYGDGPALDPFRYVFPTTGDPTAIKFQLGSNLNTGQGGPGGNAGFAGLTVQQHFDVPRITDPLNPTASSNTAIIGDPRNDENLIVVQFHHAMLRFHNAVVDLLVAAGFNGDTFIEAKKHVTQHYQWAVVNDFLKRVCGTAAVNAALAGPKAPVNSPFRMPVEFSVAAYRFGHSMIRDNYWISFVQPGASLAQVFEFNRFPQLPVHSDWVVDFNAFFDTGVNVPVHNKARAIDSALAPTLSSLPNLTGIMAVLAKRNLRRGLALGLPSGQGMAQQFGITPMTAAQLTQGLPANEVALLQQSAGALLTKTPLWYYVLREAAVLGGGNQLGPVGARIVAETFARMLYRDGNSYLRASTPFTPFLPSATPNDFTFADLVIFAGVTQP